jgi:hypothetical protein
MMPHKVKISLSIRGSERSTRKGGKERNRWQAYSIGVDTLD